MLRFKLFDREQAESGLRFLGLIIFENKLKPGTTPAIQTLRAAHFACRMVTGDNPRTAVSVGRECGLVSQSSHVFSPIFVQGMPKPLFIWGECLYVDGQGGPHTARSRVEWTSIDDPNIKLDHYTLKPPPRDMADSDEMLYHDYGLVVTGDVFRWMINHAPVETLQRVSFSYIFLRVAEILKNSANRCSSRRKYSRACHPTKSTNSSSAFNRLGIPSHSVGMVRTIARHLLLRTSASRFLNKKPALQHRLQAERPILAVLSTSFGKEGLR